MVRAAPRCVAFGKLLPVDRSRCLRCVTLANRSDVGGRLEELRMVGQGVCQVGVIAWRGRAENGVGELAVAIVAARLDLGVQAAAAAAWMARRGHALCIAGDG